MHGFNPSADSRLTHIPRSNFSARCIIKFYYFFCKKMLLNCSLFQKHCTLLKIKFKILSPQFKMLSLFDRGIRLVLILLFLLRRSKTDPLAAFGTSTSVASE